MFLIRRSCTPDYWYEQSVVISELVEVFEKAHVADLESRVQYFSKNAIEYSLVTILEEVDERDILDEVERVSYVLNTFDQIKTVLSFRLEQPANEFILVVDFLDIKNQENTFKYIFLRNNDQWLVDIVEFTFGSLSN